MAISDDVKERFEEFIDVVKNGGVGLVETTEKSTGRTVLVISVAFDNGDSIKLYPVGEFFTEYDPLDRFTPPEGAQGVIILGKIK